MPKWVSVALKIAVPIVVGALLWLIAEEKETSAPVYAALITGIVMFVCDSKAAYLRIVRVSLITLAACAAFGVYVYAAYRFAGRKGVFAAICVICAAVLLFMLYRIFHAVSVFRNGTEAEAVLLGSQRSHGSMVSLYEYCANDGSKHTFKRETSILSKPQEKITLRYDPFKPGFAADKSTVKIRIMYFFLFAAAEGIFLYMLCDILILNP